MRKNVDKLNIFNGIIYVDISSDIIKVMFVKAIRNPECQIELGRFDLAFWQNKFELAKVAAKALKLLEDNFRFPEKSNIFNIKEAHRQSLQSEAESPANFVFQ